MDADALMTELIRDEGMRLRLYKDSVGKTSIGAGRNIEDVGISEAEALMLLRNDIDRACAMLDARVPWWRGMDEERQRVLANMAYNMGPRLFTFAYSLSLMERGMYAEAASSMLQSKWAGQVGPRAQRLAARMRGQDGPLTQSS